MAATGTMTVRVPDDVRRKLERLASETDKSADSVAEEAIAFFVERELEIVAGLKRSLQDAAAGRIVAHEDAMAEIDAVIADARRR